MADSDNCRQGLHISPTCFRESYKMTFLRTGTPAFVQKSQLTGGVLSVALGGRGPLDGSEGRPRPSI